VHPIDVDKDIKFRLPNDCVRDMHDTTITSLLLGVLALSTTLVSPFSGSLVVVAAADAATTTTTSGGRLVRKPKKRCADPLGAVLRIMDCIVAQDVNCTAAGYHPDFVKSHNGVRTNDTSGIHTPAFWTGAFTLVTFDLNIDFTSQDKRKDQQQVSIRYVESVVTTNGVNLGFPRPLSTFPFNQTFIQHEHAVVTVGCKCQMVEWDQYGDTAEQKAVTQVVDALVAVLGEGGGPREGPSP
jgi:hypothetical protein